MENVFLFYVVPFLVVFLIFLIMREFMCWYWKINKISSQLEDIQGSLKKIVENQDKN